MGETVWEECKAKLFQSESGDLFQYFQLKTTVLDVHSILLIIDLDSL